MKQSVQWLAIVLFATPVPCVASMTSDTCVANSKASPDAMVHGDCGATGKDFSAATAASLPPAKIGQAWAEVQKMFGA